MKLFANQLDCPGVVRRQAGLGLMDIIVVLIVVTVLTSVSFKVVPPYLEHRTVANILSSLTEDPFAGLKSKDELRELIDKRFSFNQLGSFDIDNSIKMESSSRGTKVILHYEVRKNLVANIDIVMSFDDDFFLSSQ